MKKTIRRRDWNNSPNLACLHPILQRVYSARGVQSVDELEKGLEKLDSFQLLTHIEQAVECLVTALALEQHILIIGDFDADGATSTALTVSCLKTMGASKVSFLVPNRFEFGYGLTPEIVEVAAQCSPDLILTVDNGISSHEGVLRAREKGIKVVITDHHLPSLHLPLADAIVNPNLPGDLFPSKNLAGVGVAFYVMMALRSKLRAINWFQERNISEPNMASFLDLVALGTIADVVPFDKNNRILVHQGLARINAGKVRPGIRALIEVAGKRVERVGATDLGFIVAPRLNAAGRLVDMRLGIECLLAISEQEANGHAKTLDKLNRERQQIEEGMREQAIEAINQLELLENLPLGLCLFDETWHQGIIGILASRIKDKIHRPVITFALGTNNELKGSGRSISGFHLKDALEKIAAKEPRIIKKFGGHAMAAGLSIAKEDFEVFANLFNEIVSETISEDILTNIVLSDGELPSNTLNIETAEILQKGGPWGQAFPEPLFDGQFKIVSYRILKEKHLKLLLCSLDDYFTVDAVAFNVDTQKMNITEQDILHVAYRLDINDYKGKRELQLLIEHFDMV